MKQYLVQGLGGRVDAVEADTQQGLFNSVSALYGIPMGELRLTQAGKDIRGCDLRPGLTVWAGLRLVGGKGGGFGTLLRGQGMIVRVDNFEDCRDLNGRRIRDVNNEIRLSEWEKRKHEESKLLSATPRQTVTPSPYMPRVPPAYKHEVKEAANAMKDAVRAAALKRKAATLSEDQPSKKPEHSPSEEKPNT